MRLIDLERLFKDQSYVEIDDSPPLPKATGRAAGVEWSFVEKERTTARRDLRDRVVPERSTRFEVAQCVVVGGIEPIRFQL